MVCSSACQSTFGLFLASGCYDTTAVNRAVQRASPALPRNKPLFSVGAGSGRGTRHSPLIQHLPRSPTVGLFTSFQKGVGGRVSRSLGRGFRYQVAPCASLLAASAAFLSLLNHFPHQLFKLQDLSFYFLICLSVIFMLFWVRAKVSMYFQPSPVTQRSFYHRVLSQLLVLYTFLLCVC